MVLINLTPLRPPKAVRNHSPRYRFRMGESSTITVLLISSLYHNALEPMVSSQLWSASSNTHSDSTSILFYCEAFANFCGRFLWDLVRGRPGLKRTCHHD